MSNKKTIKHIKSIRAYIICLHADLSHGIKIKPFGLAYDSVMREFDKILKELEE